MKVIDLLNKIANGEEVPKKVKYKTFYWEYSEKDRDYKDTDKDYVFSCSNYDIPEMLNNEVEIIEEKEETKPITKESIEALGYACGEIQKRFINGWNKSLKNEPLIEEDKKIEKIEKFTEYELKHSMVNEYILGIKINELIDKINEMENK